MTLSGIPRDRLLAAAALPENKHARETILKAAGNAGAGKSIPPPTKVPQNASGDVLTVVLRIPDRDLHPNARVHWGKKQRLTREARQRACIAAKDAIGSHKLFRGEAPWWERAEVWITFYFPDKRRRDADGLLSWCKAYLDGIADAGVVANDSGLSFQPVGTEIDRETPCVRFLIKHTS